MVHRQTLTFLCLIAFGEAALGDQLDNFPTIDEIIDDRHSACTAENASQVWEFTLHGFSKNSSLLSDGVPKAMEILGEPISSERDEKGGWDIDVYVINRTISFEGVKIVTQDYMNQGFEVDLETAEFEDGTDIHKMVVDGQQLQLMFGIRIGSTRAQVEEALKLPCWPVAHSGRLAVRQLSSYEYLTSDPSSSAEYSVAFKFDDADTVKSVVWERLPWH